VRKVGKLTSLTIVFNGKPSDWLLNESRFMVDIIEEAQRERCQMGKDQKE
jgi:hypothetical protein